MRGLFVRPAGLALAASLGALLLCASEESTAFAQGRRKATPAKPAATATAPVAATALAVGEGGASNGGQVQPDAADGQANRERFESFEKRLSKLTVVANRQQMVEFEAIEELRKGIDIGHLPAAAQARAVRADKRLTVLRASPRLKAVRLAMEQEEQRRAEAERAAEAARKQDFVNGILLAGRQAVLRGLRSPSSARFVGDNIAKMCTNGTFITVHELDAQNGFGAVIRGTQCAIVHPDLGKAIPGGCDVIIPDPEEKLCDGLLEFVRRGYY